VHVSTMIQKSYGCSFMKFGMAVRVRVRVSRHIRPQEGANSDSRGARVPLLDSE